jgi:hypothetical protein
MLAAARIFAFAVCTVTLVGCNRFTEAKLLGTWRAEGDETVEEMACRKDHSFTSWTSSKNELTTPSVGIAAGDWQLQGHELAVHFTKYVPVNTWADEDRQIRFTIVQIRNDALLMKNFDGSKVITYKRLSHYCALAPIKRAPNDADFVGTWQIHYNTHDFEMSFSRDHRYGDFAKVGGVLEEFFTGTWHTDGDQLIVDAKSVPMFEGDSVHQSQLRWLVIGIEPQRIAIRDGPVPYCLERLK